MTIPDELIEEVARRMCVAQGLDPEEVGYFREHSDYYCHRWRGFEDRARDAIAAHIALAEIMPPGRATLLAVADVVQQTIGASLSEAGVVWHIFANALRAKAKGDKE